MKRILYVLANEPTGGVGVFVRDYCTHFSECVHVDYLMYTETRDSVFQNAIRREDTIIYYLPEYTLKNLNMLRRRTDEFFRVHAKEYDIVHLTYPGQMRLVLGPAKKYGVPVRILHSFNARLSDDPLKSGLNKALLAGMRNYASDYMACSLNAAEYLFGKKAVKEGQVTFIRNAIDTAAYAWDPDSREQLRKEYGISASQKLILAAGRFEEQKNIAFAVDVFASLRKKDKEAVLFLIGDGPLRSEIEERVKMHGIGDAVRFIGFTDRLSAFFNAADLLLFPSLYEGLPITVIDAQCCGLPCVLSDTITREVQLCDLITYCSLKESPDVWADVCGRSFVKERYDHGGILKEKGYDIVTEAKKLEEYYLNTGERK